MAPLLVRLSSIALSNAGITETTSQSNATSLPPCPDSPSSGAFSNSCNPTPDDYPAHYSAGQLGVIGFVSCAAVLVAAGGFLWWAYKGRRRAANPTTTSVSVGLPPAIGAQPVPQTVRIPRSAFARRKKRVPALARTPRDNTSEHSHELQPNPAPARNPDGTIRDEWDEEGLETMATWETVDTLVGEKPEGEEGKDETGVGEVPIAIQRLTLGPVAETREVLAEPTPPSPAYHPPGAQRSQYVPVPEVDPKTPTTPSHPSTSR
ncbi:hypothetical protein DACRYDRAFT_101033 [Dacryopinax primogenitus]|uniref:Transmembrane protein n=1 Tax=Dacryopinax primogenitus (strain DJM 731) TaxID=1858805 RepID=M5FRR0_DACPD|nr:uncharacterized protein DACRYDRAFT_101033 [Dacryopinax primogenitus]EJT99895.1 hypothetical protein DACRYDRAFT_101033 [Dacryopinax primogenitus]